MNPTIAVIGLGYIGLPTAAALAAPGTRVHGIDVSQRTVDMVNRGELPFVEPGLEQALQSAVRRGDLTASTTTPHADVYIVAVPTPFQDDHQADLSYIEAATRTLSAQLTGGELVILESTSPPGTTEKMGEWIDEERPDLAGNVLLAHCPERVLPGRVMIELVKNDRVIGGVTPEAAVAAQQVYRIFCEGELLLTDARTAEMAKLVENSYRDVNIAFANELSQVAAKLDIDVWELINLANHHPRVNILQPGPGVGGHCIAVDPWFIVSAAPQESRLIRTAREVNDAKPHQVIDQILAHAKDVENPTIALLGLAFKANIDDLRESPARYIAKELADRLPEATILAVEPHVEELPAELAALSNVRLSPLNEALEASQVVALLVDHDLFGLVDHAVLADKAVVDTRGLWRNV
ncbi:nucleotide sugar dehydrogenase [Sanguibacter keddieii DSM 10542]|uniref:Nucleotide sugar dehydrogenase n=1 Tax=Sanguibacter keddieii (strain ATCC 51767 / DSM 10542 / NCFB 3025 / ST-74) TaxID=446469 RepID=D1BC51_SANKS|nr:UDP-N-acetyl-D-mannosamine dehydrogenase [Sanguibacter keddieii]ACZ20831.1 nucleotide sugar dehydrogenase [Sanguibacter keddieii DSM 10542]